MKSILFPTCALVATAALAHAGAAHLPRPTLDAVKAAVPKWTDAIALPFTYQGLRYENDDYAKVTACEKAFGAHGVLKDAKKLPQFVGCVAMSTARDALVGKPDVAEYDSKHPGDELSATIDANVDGPLKEVQKGYPAKLSSLTGDGGGLYVAHGTKPDSDNGYWTDAWNVYVAHTADGAVTFNAVVVELAEQSPD